jgi:DNA-binding MarR family transcriptional regulator
MYASNLHDASCIPKLDDASSSVGYRGWMATTRWLNEAEQRAWRAFLTMHGQLVARLNRQLQVDSGLSIADYEVLVHLSEAADGRLRPFELQQRLHWEQSRVSHQLTRMQGRGLISREECGEDGRGSFVVLTGDGRHAIEAAAPGHVGAVRSLFFEALSRDQVATLERLSTDVLHRLSASSPG